MAIRRLRVFMGPEVERPEAVGVLPLPSRPATVRVSLGDVLPLLADALASDRTWLGDFADDEIEISADLHDVLEAYRHFRRPGA